MEVLEVRIGLPKGTLAALHKEGDISGSESRVILKSAPGQKGYVPEGVGEDGNPAAAIGRVVSFVEDNVQAKLTTLSFAVLTPTLACVRRPSESHALSAS